MRAKFDWNLVPLAPKGARWFVKSEARTSYVHGFRNRQEIEDWYQRMRKEDRLEWSSGALFRLVGQLTGLIIDRQGREWKP